MKIFLLDSFFKKKEILAVTLSFFSFGLSFVVNIASQKCDAVLKILVFRYNQLSYAEWYDNIEARTYYHKILPYESEIIYWWPIHCAVSILLLAISCFFCKSFKNKTCNLINILTIIQWLYSYIFFNKTWIIVSHIVD